MGAAAVYMYTRNDAAFKYVAAFEMFAFAKRKCKDHSVPLGIPIFSRLTAILILAI